MQIKTCVVSEGILTQSPRAYSLNPNANRNRVSSDLSIGLVRGYDGGERRLQA